MAVKASRRGRPITRIQRCPFGTPACRDRERMTAREKDRRGRLDPRDRDLLK